jgi:hypothetical protein
MIFLFKICILSFLLNKICGVLYPIAVRLPLLGDPPLPGAALWPKPLKLEQTNLYYFLHKTDFKFQVSNSKTNACEREIIDMRIKYYLNILFPPKIAYEFPSKADKQLKNLIIEIQKSNSIPGNCKQEYYPDITDTETEKCNLHI